MASGSNVYRPKLTGVLIAAILLVMVVVVILISTILIVATGRSGGDTTTAPDSQWETPTTTPATTPTTTPPTTTQGGTTDPNDPNDPGTVTPGANTITVSRDEVGQGTLVLIDSNHFYRRNGLIPYKDLTAMSAELLGFSALSASGGTYSLSKGNLFLHSDAKEAFEKMAADLTVEVGNELQVRNAYYYNASLVAVTSQDSLESVEHSTGMVLDLQIYSGKKVYPMDYPKFQSTYYAWLTENCWKYGYVHVRDTANYSTFRYVGVPHAAAMKKYAVDLSNYLLAVTAYNFDNRLKVTDSAGSEWWIYYVQALTDPVTVPVIGDETAYTISGDNSNGFVVAINSAVFAQ